MAGDMRVKAVGTGVLQSLRQALGQAIGGPVPATEAADQSNAGTRRGALYGPRGKRILPADFPLNLLDRLAPRGTYVDLLV